MSMLAGRCPSTILLVLFIAACGGDDNGSPGPLPSRTPTETFLRTTTNTPTSTPTPTVTADRLVVMTDSGALRGTAREGVRSFLGVPYAEPPVGDLRWRPPAPHPGWTGTRDAIKPGNSCPQKIPIINAPAGTEDCLFLNIHTPDPPPQEPAPVMVWIHGGAFTTGDGLQFSGATDGSVIVQHGGVVVVSLNYRLAQFGFLAHAALTNEDPAHPSSGNYGIEDQIAALQWVQRNISAFGGDPGNVTIFGESAGGWSVCLHLASPPSAGLFSRAIIQSGICIQPLASLQADEVQGSAFAARLGCDGAVDVPGCLRSKSVSQIRETLPPDPAFASSEGDFGSWSPNLDGYLFREQMADAFAAGRFNQVPAIVGSTEDEGTLFLMMSGGGTEELTAEQYADRLRSILQDEELVSAVTAQYPLDAFPSSFAALSAVFGDAFLACPTIETAHMLASYVPTYLYQFEFPDAAFVIGGSVDLGAFHSAEVQYLFGRPASRAFTEEERELSRQMMGYWTRFAATGDANGDGAVRWPLHDGTDQHLVLDRAITARTGAKADSCSFWRGLDYRRPVLQ